MHARRTYIGGVTGERRWVGGGTVFLKRNTGESPESSGKRKVVRKGLYIVGTMRCRQPLSVRRGRPEKKRNI
ncbi:hypothetical protein E2C01_094041 [Portunus trituberculatus]|uniref:Uncharacterized protein n=1 Tax=Portunus trituberculatus TaxID=210409 RepID=A0A5B7JRG3_PORTR|nr:hypothetical protein [Portunus trituberculatus]